MQETALDILQEQRERLRRRGICVIVPTYNNMGTVRDVVERCKRQCDDVIVVNDGCTDSTAEILASIDGITVVTLDKNSGKGAALKRGFLKAREFGFAYAITIDADGQHFPEDIAQLLEANIKHPGALIVGERKDLAEKERSRGSKFANIFSNFWFFVQTLKPLKDTQTGFRLYPLRKLYGLRLLTSRYEAELELMVFAAWHGVKLVSIPVNVYYPKKEERVSHFRPVADFARISVLNTFLCIFAGIYALPLYLWRTVMTALRSAYSLLFFVVFTLFVMTPMASLYLHFGKITDHRRYRLHCLLQFMAAFVLKYHKIPGVRFSVSNPHKEDFKKPAVIICNHQSHLDLMTLLVLHRKIIVLTNDWVWNNPFYGYIIRNAEFYPVSAGIDNILPQLRNLVRRGYSIAVYPEGTRSVDCSIGRFHKGAFYIASQLGLDIVPLVLYGAGKVLPKKGKHLRKGIMQIDIDRRFTAEELAAMGEEKKQSSWFRKYYIKRYAAMCDKLEQYV